MKPEIKKQLLTDLSKNAWLASKGINYEKFVDYLENRGFCVGSFNDIWHGEIKTCPSCKVYVVTDCCACGCGFCLSCGHRFSCNSPSFDLNLSKISSAEEQEKLEKSIEETYQRAKKETERLLGKSNLTEEQERENERKVKSELRAFHVLLKAEKEAGVGYDIGGGKTKKNGN